MYLNIKVELNFRSWSVQYYTEFKDYVLISTFQFFLLLIFLPNEMHAENSEIFLFEMFKPTRTYPHQ